MKRFNPRVAFVVGLAAALAATLAGCPESVDLTTGRYYTCSRDAGAPSCAMGWRCGLEGFCHPADGGAWECADDSDCDAPWRCGAEKHCVDPSSDGLDSRAWPLPDVELVSPAYAAQPIEVVTASGKSAFVDRCTDAINLDFCGGPYDYDLDENVSFVSGGNVVQALRLRNVYLDAPGGLHQFFFRDGGTYPTSVATVAVAPDAGIAALAAAGFTTFALSNQSQMYALRGSLDGGTGALTPVPLFTLPGPYAPNALVTERAAKQDFEQILVSYERGGSRLAVFSLADAGTSGVLGSPSKIAGDPIRKLETFYYYWDDPASLLAVTDAGLYSAWRDTSGFSQNDGGHQALRPVFLPVDLRYDGGTSWVLPQQVGRRVVDAWSRDEYLLVETVEGSGANAIHRVGFHNWWIDAYSDAIHIDPPYDEVGCDPGDVVSVADGRFAESGQPFTLTAVCLHANADGSTTEYVKAVQVHTDCQNYCPASDTEAQCRAQCDPSGTAPNTGVRSLALTGPDRSGFADIHGRVIVNGDFDKIDSLTLPKAPAHVVGRQGSLEAWTDSNRFAPFFLTEHFHSVQVGLAQTLNWDLIAPPKYPVRGNSKWRVELLQSGPAVSKPLPDGGWQSVFTMPAISDLRLGPWEGQYFSMLGQTGMAVSAFDTILSGVVGIDSVLQVRVVPNPRAPVTSFSFRETTDAGSIVDGYAVSQGRLFRVTAETLVRWVSSEVELAVLFATPNTVWLDGPKGRVALSDGRVFALPSRVLLAPPLPEFAPDTSKFAFVCGQTFALGRQHLYRLDTSSGQPIGAWVPVSEAEALVPGAAREPGWAGGTLHVVDEALEHALYLFTEHGTAVRVGFTTCP